MRLRSWLTFGISGILLLIKLLVISVDQYETLTGAYYIPTLSADDLVRIVKYHRILIEPLMLTISLVGFIIRGRTGFLLTTLFPYFILISWPITFFSGNYFFGANELGQLSFPVFVIILLNLKSSRQKFLMNTNYKLDWQINLFGFAVGLVVNTGLFAWTYFD